MKVDWHAAEWGTKKLGVVLVIFPWVDNLQILSANRNQDTVSNYLSNLADP
jgi:hypothetical protein